MVVMANECLHGGEPTNLLRKGAKYCSNSCKMKAYRSRKRSSEVFPKRMRDSDRWLRWERVRRGPRVTKRPVAVSGRAGSSTNPETWSDYETAKTSKLGHGIGFALGEDIGCIDLDDAIVDGQVQDWAQDILDQLPSTFIEVSQSGNGLHIFGLIPERPGRNTGRGVEVYSAGRFIAMTGDRFDNAPSRLADLSSLVSRIL